jgi:hypothetical protein
MKRAQIAIEFVIVISLAFSLVLIFMVINTYKISDVARSREILLLQQETASISDELIAASIVQDGYSRRFMIGEDLYNLNFSASVNNTLLITRTKNYELVQRVPPANGSLVNGENIIRKEGGIIYLNS